MGKQPKVHMVQIYGHLWRIVSESGHVINNNIRLNSTQEAEDYVRRYVSSYNWLYELKPKEIK